MTLPDFAGRVALVTGAARGLGYAAAMRLLAGGARVVLNVRRAEQVATLEEKLGKLTQGAEGRQPRAMVLAGDVAGAPAVRAIVAEALDRFGRLDVLVNNAAAAYSTRFEQIDEEEWRRAIDVNLTAAFLCIQAALPPMKANGYGRVVNLSSTAGKSVSTLGGAHYTASKAGLLGLTRAAAKELGPYGVTVNAVCPGLIDTELTREHATPEQLAAYASSFPVRRLGTAEEVADLIAFLASEQAGYITGASIDINGGDLMI
ncbi:MAG TPA: SDR family NAD(P)-dependent oxidoreductase [Thermoanaerobaculia bacterium]|jgi:NAD(P)-dependent dehydrogenase (short-subunit alcohol dehydrogenase family)|nr:SDR family NAD(P)-dependent oxidoreductase [Thermoanaerobaculia bacterium]